MGINRRRSRLTRCTCCSATSRTPKLTTAAQLLRARRVASNRMTISENCKLFIVSRFLGLVGVRTLPVRARLRHHEVRLQHVHGVVRQRGDELGAAIHGVRPPNVRRGLCAKIVHHPFDFVWGSGVDGLEAARSGDRSDTLQWALRRRPAVQRPGR